MGLGEPCFDKLEALLAHAMLSIPATKGFEIGSGFAGTQTAALMAGGNSPPITNLTEEYGGAAWTAGGVLGTGRSYLAGCGLQTAGLAFGGSAPSQTAVAEEWTIPSFTAKTVDTD